MIVNEQIVEKLTQSTDMMSLITTFISSGNFVMAIVLGGSMQLLYGLIRSM